MKKKWLALASAGAIVAGLVALTRSGACDVCAGWPLIANSTSELSSRGGNARIPLSAVSKADSTPKRETALVAPANSSTPNATSLVNEITRSITNFSEIVALTRKPVTQLSNDELSVTLYLASLCDNVLATAPPYDAATPKFSDQKAQVQHETRRAATRKMVDVCEQATRDGMPRNIAFSLRNEDINRSSPGSVNFQVAHALTFGDPERAVSSVEAAVSSRDPLALQTSFAQFDTLAEQAGLVEEFRASGLTTENLWDAWALARCALANGCAADSPVVLALCSMEGKCGASLESALQQSDPARYADLLRLRDQMIASYKGGDWAWLNLQRLNKARKSAPAA
jgi:hypothetical protein